MKFQCLIIEDELPAQRILQEYINDVSDLELVATCMSALDATEILRQQHVDLIFLDIHLPKLSGINFIKSLKTTPNIIITTAYPNYAIEGYELNIIDYLLKPFSFERFLKSINKVTSKYNFEHNSLANPNNSNENFIFIKSENKVIRIDLNDILFIEAQNEYVKIIYGTQSVLVFQSLKYYESILPQNIFMRAHKSYIINMRKIDSIIGNLIKIGKDSIPIGRKFREKFNLYINDYLLKNRDSNKKI